MANYPPYVNAYGLLPNFFKAITTANVPTKFNRDFVSTMLGLKSSSYIAMIPFLKNLGFLDQGNVPTQDYKDYRDERGKLVMAKRVRESYPELFTANAYAHRLTKEQVAAKLRSILGLGEDDKTIPNVAGTFTELCSLGDFEGEITKEKTASKTENVPDIIRSPIPTTKIGLSYTINLNLPPSTDIEVFNAIFKSLKEHILNE